MSPQPAPLRDYQVADLAFLMSNPRSLLLHDPGGGKTPPVCVWMWWRWNQAQKRTIWVMPIALFQKNKKELLRFTHFEPDDIAIVNEHNHRSDAKVFIMSAARFRLSGEKMISDYRDIDGVVGDEIHMFWSTASSQQTRSFFRAMERVTSFIGMTGTLIKGRLSSAYPVIHVIEPRYYPSYGAFMNHHAITDVYGNVVAWKNPDRIAAIIGKHAIKRSFASIYGEESKVIVTELCEMGAKQREAYSQFEAEAILELDDGFLDGTVGAIHTLRCRQIMAHPETFGIGDKEATGKDEQLRIHLADHANSGDPLIIFACFKAEQERIVRLVESKGMTCALLNGDVSTKKRAQIDEDFRAGRTQVLVGSPIVAAIGFNWDHVNHIVFTTLDYSDDSFVQGYRRAIRGVRKTPLLITLLEYEDSIDQRVMKMIKKKSALANKVDGDKEVFDLSVAS